jgi:hypothetical protein
MLNSTSGTRRQERCEEEVVSRRYHDNIVVFRVELFEERYSPPTGAYVSISCGTRGIKLWILT